MKQTITITPRWQIHLPLKVRQELDLDKPGKAELEVRNDKIIIKPHKSRLLSLGGKYRRRGKKQKINLAKIRDQIDYSQL